ncbi:MAG: hypothetical protein WDZ80_04935 [Candidatus Paceibacterota bacterium]
MRKLLIIIVVLTLLVIPFVFIEAQTTPSSSEVIITWKANNFYPSNYQNKAPVTRNSSIDVSLELIENQRMVNLSGDVVTWYLDGTFFIKGPGIDEISFESNKLNGDSHRVRAIIEGSGRTVERTIVIPVKNYESIIETRLSGSSVQLGSSLNLTAFPYFFNIESLNELSFNWTVNGEERKDTTNEISLNVGANPDLVGSRILINSTIINQADLTESARSTKNLTITN